MTLRAPSLTSLAAARFGERPTRHAEPSDFAEMDDRVTSGARGPLVVAAPSRDGAWAAAAHLARRLAAAGALPVVARAGAGAPLWREIGVQLGIQTLACEPLRCATEIQQACGARRAAILAPLPAPGTWDRLVAVELARLEAAPLIVFLTTGPEPASDLRAPSFNLATTLEGDDLRRWWAAVADAAHGEAAGAELGALENWWSSARRAPVGRTAPRASQLSEPERRAFAALALASRSWPAERTSALGLEDETVRALIRAGAALLTRAGVSIAPPWDAAANDEEAAADPSFARVVAEAMVGTFADDPWALARASELLLRAGEIDEADRTLAQASTLLDDHAARRELLSRWMRAVHALPREEQLDLAKRAVYRALAAGESDEAFRWAQSATTLAPNDAGVALLFGRAAIAMGDLVAAKVALERGQQATTDPDVQAELAVDLAEVAYLGGDVTGARRGAEAATAVPNVATRLRARNLLGKILLAQAEWDAADRHFAEDTWLASSHGLATPELRARLNRGIALLSRGMVDEARSIFEAVLADAERVGDARACGFALSNLAVVATNRHQYAHAIAYYERTLTLRQRLGGRVATATTLANLAELRRRLGLLDHAEHALAFGRRALGPGMPPALSARFCIFAAKIALARGNSSDARREIARAITDYEAAGQREYLGGAHCISARIALEDGDLAKAGAAIAAARDLATSDEGRAEVALLTAMYARACGDNDERAATEALTLARAAGDEELLLESQRLLAEVHRANGNLDAARAHLEQALALRDQVGSTLPPEVRTAFFARPHVVVLARLQAILSDGAPSSDRASREPEESAAVPRSRGSSPPPPPRELVGDDPAVRALLAAVRRVARSNSTVLIRGESGTGKELVAEAIHRASERAEGPLVTVNCAALVETLLLSELFGHEKGAFTGAMARRRGRFELAEGGSLFLDEIGDISPRTQVALLRVLQERTFERVGGTTPIRANVRILCATHRDLKGMVERGEFREDLYYRLRGITLELPPLRQRMGDLPRIAENLLSRIAAERGDAPKQLAADAVDLMQRHRWPGNVRELENALRASSLFADGGTITASCLVENVDELRAVALGGPTSRRSVLPPDDPSTEETDLEDGELPLGEANATAVAYAQVRHGSVSLSDLKRQIERDCIARALAETKGNITRAATLLGMKRPRLSQLVKQYGLSAVSSEVS